MRRLARSIVTGVVLGAVIAVPAVAAPSTPSTSASTTAAASVGATGAWARGITGEGVGIALVDTGVSPRPELHDAVAGQIEVGPPGRRTDGHGHGTFLAGLIAANDGPDGPLGVAPGAHVVSFKVADAQGRTTLEQVVTALGAVRLTAEDLGIRVVVLAIGGPADELADPVEQALEDLWASGLVVVVASGNDGAMVTEPGVSPYLLTAGATDDRGTADRQDDVVPVWSGRGTGRDGRAKPDVHAPGASVVSTRVPGSSADREHPSSRIDGRWFRGSGTSMAAAVTAGAAALVLDADPTLTPDEVKGRLMASAVPSTANPAGGLDVNAAMAADGAVANTHLPVLQPSRGPAPSDELQEVAVSVQLDGWDGRSWIGRSWIGRSWIGRSWIELEWDGRSWIGRSWIGRSWIGRSWIGRSWITDQWVGQSWTSATF